jgi:hypothetical protein
MRKLVLAVLVAALGLGQPAIGAAQPVLYDDFSSGVLDPGKWYAFDVALVGGSRATETARLIRFGMLELRANQYGANNSDSGDATLVTGVNIQDPTPITTHQAVVTVLSGEATACPTNPGATSSARAEISGNYFNDGASTGPSDATGNIIANVRLNAGGDGTRTILGRVTRCSNGGCTSSSTVVSQTFAATWAPRQPVRLTLTWDQPNSQFVVSAKPVFGGQTETHNLPYALSDSTPSTAPSRSLRLVHVAPNCNGSRKHAFMDALYDSVMVSQ